MVEMQDQGLCCKETKGNAKGNVKHFFWLSWLFLQQENSLWAPFLNCLVYFTAAIPLNNRNIPEHRKDNLGDSSFSGRRIKCCFQCSCSQPPPPPLILSIDALGKLNINSSFLPCQVGQRVKPKRSWQLTFIHLHPIKRNSQLLMSCYSLQREKVWKMEKIPKCHKNVRFGSDLPTHGSFPSKRLFISLPT